MKPECVSLKTSDFLPRNVKIFIPEEQKRVLTESVAKFGSEQKLANHIGVSRGTINDWKFERSRIGLGYYLKLKGLLDENITDAIQFQTHKRNTIKVSRIEISPELAWIFGFRQGDRDEDKFSIGIGTSDPEIAVEFIEILKTVINIEGNELWCQISVPKDKISRKDVVNTKIKYSGILDIPENIIRVRPRGRTERHKRYHIVIRYYNMLVRVLFLNIEKEFNKRISSFDPKTQGHYLKGLIDSEGTIYSSGRTVISMRPSHCLEIASYVLKNLNIRFNLFKYPQRNMHSLTIYGPASKIIELCCPVHKVKSHKLKNCTQLLRMG